MAKALLPKPQGYDEALSDFVARIRAAQFRAAGSANRELVLLYWGLGRDILDRQERQGWGSKVVDRLAGDLRRTFPGVRGFSARNLRNMRDLAREFPDDPIWQQLLPNCPWGHLLQLMAKVKDRSAREWYARACIEHGWSRNVFSMQIESNLYARQGGAVTNFHRTLPSPQSDLAKQTIKDPYNFDFLMLDAAAREREVEQGLMDHLQRFLVELGVGFAFVGRQYRLDVAGDEFFLDLLFYHLKLRCFVVIELKGGDFKPEYAGKLNFYLAAVNELLTHSDDQPTIGLLLCRGKNKALVAEWALKGIDRPIGVAEYQLTEALPEEFKGKLPTIEDLEEELGTLPDEESG